MRNFAVNTRFNIHVDLNKSQGSYIYDKNTNKKYLDLFGMYASLPLGYNHEVFKSDSYKKEMLEASTFKINNCEFITDAALEFDSLFKDYAGKGIYKYFHYCCTGALAIEAAIKASMEYKGHSVPKIISFHNSFHGINSYGGFITSRFWPVDQKLSNLPEPFSVKAHPDLQAIEDHIKKGDITCVVVEPIQCSVGDIHLDYDFLKSLRDLTEQHNVPLIFDEIQVGFGGTGKLWFYEHLGFNPDIVVFGKKTQVSGIMVQEKFGNIFGKDKVTKLAVTWNSDIVDMIRCKYIMQAYKKYNILENVNIVSEYIKSYMKNDDTIINFRNKGLIIAFDLKNKQKRDIIADKMFELGLLTNPTGDRSIRIRPSLNLSKEDAKIAISVIKEVI